MAEEKRIKVSADVTPLQELREKAISLYREINQSASATDEIAEKNLQKLREELSLMKDRNELEKLLLDLKKQNQSLTQQNNFLQSSDLSNSPSVQSSKTNSIIEWNNENEEAESLQQSSQKGRKKKNRSFTTSEPIINEDDSVEWRVSYEDEKEPLKKRGRRKRKKKEESDDNIDYSLDNQDYNVLKNINRHVENIDESVTNRNESKLNIDKSIKDIDESVTTTNRRKENIDESTINKTTETINNLETVKNIDRNVENVVENTSYIQRFIEKKSQPFILSDDNNENLEKIFNKKNNEENGDKNAATTTEERNTSIIATLNDENIVKAINIVDANITRSCEKILEAILNSNNKIQPNNLNSSSVNRYLNTIADILSRIEDEITDNHNTGRTSGNTKPTTTNNSGLGGIGDSLGSGLSLGSNGFLGNLVSKFLGPFALTGLIFSTVKNAASTIMNRAQRNYEFDYQSPLMTSIERQSAQTRLEGQNKADSVRWIPLIGDYLAKRKETSYNALADAQRIARQTKLTMESPIMSYTQTLGGSTNKAFREMAEEGSYAPQSLGMDFSQYAQRRGELIRAAGGTYRGGDYTDPTAIKETQSLMAVEKLYGLRGIDQLQSVMRFGDRNENLGGSAVILAFERTMKNLELPFSEIASTMDESLKTFTSEANRILEKTGDFDSATLAATLAGVREYTGAEGRQLERYQQMATGSGLSQDDVTNAIVMRAITNNTNASTFSEAMSYKENLANHPEIMKSVLKDTQNMTSTNEQFIQVLQKMFPGLSFTDLRDLSDKGGGRIDIDALFEQIMSKRLQIGSKGEERGLEQRYEKTIASEKIGSETAWSAQDTQRLLGAIDEIKNLMKVDKNRQEELEDTAIQVAKKTATTIPFTPLGATALGMVAGNKLISLIHNLMTNEE